MNSKIYLAPKPNKGRFVIAIMLALVVAGGAVSLLTSGGGGHRPMLRKTETQVTLLPPPPLPPPPPPPPPPPAPKVEEMVEQEHVEIDEPEPSPAAPPADDALATNILGNGPDMGLRAGTGGGGGNRNQVGSGRRSGKWDHYAVTVQNTIAETLRGNSGVRHAAFTIKVRVWADTNGRITRASLVGSSGDSSVDQAIRNQVLTGLQLPEPPPADMPMPINMRIAARKS